MSSERSLRLGIVGYLMGRARYGAALMSLPSVRIVGIADPDTRVARVWARSLTEKPPVFATPEELLAEVPDLDALLIAVPLRDRAPWITRALLAGKSVLADFPFTARLTDTDTLLQIAEANSVALIPTLTRRFDPAFERAAQLLESGAIGGLRQARCEWSFPYTFAFGLENGVALEEGAWHDLLQAIACQTVDVCRWWLGEAHSVSADIDLPRASGGTALVRRGAEPQSNLIVAHAQGQSTHHLSRSRATLATERYVISGALGHLELVISASEAAVGASLPSLTLHLPGRRPENALAETDFGDPDSTPAALRTRRLLDHFATALQEGTSPLSSGKEARIALEIVHAAYLSTHENLKVSLPLRRDPDIEAILAGHPPGV